MKKGLVLNARTCKAEQENVTSGFILKLSGEARVTAHGSTPHGNQNRCRIGSIEVLDKRPPFGTQQFESHPGLKPSYVHVACAVSGYSDLNIYDSKKRSEFRSRENCPVTFAWIRSPNSRTEGNHTTIILSFSVNLPRTTINAVCQSMAYGDHAEVNLYIVHFVFGPATERLQNLLKVPSE